MARILRRKIAKNLRSIFSTAVRRDMGCNSAICLRVDVCIKNSTNSNPKSLIIQEQGVHATLNVESGFFSFCIISALRLKKGLKKFCHKVKWSSQQRNSKMKKALMAVCFLLLLMETNTWRRRRRRRRSSPPCKAVNCLVSSWTSWSSCSHLCGTSGTQRRTRHQTRAASCGGSCPYSLLETRKCNRDACQHGGTPHSSGCTCRAGYGGSCCGKSECTYCWIKSPQNLSMFLKQCK